MAEKMAFETVSETLFVPLYALALESRRPNPILADERAVALTEQIEASFAASSRRLPKQIAAHRLPGSLVTSLVLRIRQYDRYVTQFLQREPEGVVVSLGCGLDNRRQRVDNGRVRWYDLDLPEVIALRRQFLSENERMRFISASALDPAWLDQLPDEPSRRFLFLAEGLFMYLEPDGVRSLVTRLCDRFAGAELVAEVANRRIVRMMQGPLARGKLRRRLGLSGNVVYRFGLESSREMESWSPGLALLDDWTYFDEDEPKLGMLRLFARWPLFRRAQWTVHYRLGGSAEA